MIVSPILLLILQCIVVSAFQTKRRACRPSVGGRYVENTYLAGGGIEELITGRDLNTQQPDSLAANWVDVKQLEAGATMLVRVESVVVGFKSIKQR